MELLANVCPFPIVPVPIFWRENPWDIVGWAVSMSLAITLFGLTRFGRNKQKYRGWHFRRIALCSFIFGCLLAMRSNAIWEQKKRDEGLPRLREAFEAFEKEKIERSIREKELLKKDNDPNSFKK